MIENTYPYFWLPFAIAGLALWIMQSPRIMTFMLGTEVNQDE